MKLTSAIKAQLKRLGVQAEDYGSFTKEGVAHLQSTYRQKRKDKVEFLKNRGSSRNNI